MYETYAHQDGFLTALIGLFRDEDTQVGATWLFKQACEARHEGLTSLKPNDFYDALIVIKERDAILHGLQSLPSIPIPAESRLDAETFVRKAMESDAKFVRAWAYNGFHTLAATFPAYQKEALTRLTDALNTENSAAVKARIRNALKEGFDQT